MVRFTFFTFLVVCVGVCGPALISEMWFINSLYAVSLLPTAYCTVNIFDTAVLRMNIVCVCCYVYGSSLTYQPDALFLIRQCIRALGIVLEMIVPRGNMLYAYSLQHSIIYSKVFSDWKLNLDKLLGAIEHWVPNKQPFINITVVGAWLGNGAQTRSEMEIETFRLYRFPH